MEIKMQLKSFFFLYLKRRCWFWSWRLCCYGIACVWFTTSMIEPHHDASDVKWFAFRECDDAVAVSVKEFSSTYILRLVIFQIRKHIFFILTICNNSKHPVSLLHFNSSEDRWGGMYRISKHMSVCANPFYGSFHSRFMDDHWCQVERKIHIIWMLYLCRILVRDVRWGLFWWLFGLASVVLYFYRGGGQVEEINKYIFKISILRHNPFHDTYKTCCINASLVSSSLHSSNQYVLTLQKFHFSCPHERLKASIWIFIASAFRSNKLNEYFF